MYRFSYLITYRQSDQGRQHNLHFLLQQLSLDRSLEIILVEQDATPQFKNQQQANIKYVFVENSGRFNKSWGLNIAANYASCERLVFADSDMLISAAALDEICQQMNNDVDAINPYDVLVDLSQEESQQLLAQTQSLHINRTRQQTNRQSIGQYPPFCGGAFALTRRLYHATGGMDERFEGWGAEDDAMSKRVAFFATKMATLKGIAYHLWHQSSEPNGIDPQSYIRNLSLLTLYYERPPSFYRSIAQKDITTNAQQTKYRLADKPSSSNSPAPLISCLCVTRGRVALLERAIDCFQAQSYSHKELVVISESDDTATHKFLKGLNNKEIRHHVVPIEAKKSLGDLRNFSIEMAKGRFVCQWDDDDWYHPTRLSRQLESALKQNKAASVLPRWLIHRRENNKVYCSNIRLWEGSVLCRKDALPVNMAYDSKRKGEDSKLIETLFIEDQLAIEDFPELYVYCLSGENTWDTAHFEKIIDASVELSPQESEIVRSKIGVTDEKRSTIK
ncbi:MAG: glycosyltransferase involved in cell wall biosynthesis [Arenicella sp.]|jgi:glycosyltransferase involved in cell wall biosynthesis